MKDHVLNLTDLKGGGLFLFALILILFICFLASYQQGRREKKEVDQVMDRGGKESRAAIEKEDLEGLPPVVRRWLTVSGLVGERPLQGIVIKQVGQIRLKKDQEWMPSSALQHINVRRPAFHWALDLDFHPFLPIKGRDMLYQEKASMEIRLFSLLKAVNEKDNRKLDESALHRFLLELAWYPSAALEDYMSWQELEGNKARAILSLKGMQVEADFYFDDDGYVEAMEAYRYKETGPEAKRLLCRGRVTEHRQVEGLTLPYRCEISWLIDGAFFTWYTFENQEIRLIP